MLQPISYGNGNRRLVKRTRALRSGLTSRRGKGGGGGHGSSGHGEGGESGGSSGGGGKSPGESSSGGSTGSHPNSDPPPPYSPPIHPLDVPGVTNGKAVPRGAGGGPSVAIPNGQPFAGRQEGGGTRDQVYGTSVYGSGYPGYATRGVFNRPFPFYYWPMVWIPPIYTHPGYINTSNEYGKPSNSSRPGGPMSFASVKSSSSNATSSNTTSTFYVISDRDTVASLIDAISNTCGSLATSGPVTAFNDTDNSVAVQPEQTIQYYRASSVALTLDGYNNTALFNTDDSINAPPSPLPNTTDTTLLACLNQTIGETVPLIQSGAFQLNPMPQLQLLVFIWTIWMVFLR